MIQLKDRRGNLIVTLDKLQFPLKLEVETVLGKKERIIYLNMVKDDNKQPTEHIKSVNMG